MREAFKSCISTRKSEICLNFNFRIFPGFQRVKTWEEIWQFWDFLQRAELKSCSWGWLRRAGLGWGWLSLIRNSVIKTFLFSSEKQGNVTKLQNAIFGKPELSNKLEKANQTYSLQLKLRHGSMILATLNIGESRSQEEIEVLKFDVDDILRAGQSNFLAH